MKIIRLYVLKSMIKSGVAVDVASLDEDEYQELCRSNETIAVSTDVYCVNGIYGVNGVLVERNGKLYASVGRNTRTLSIIM